MELVCKHCGMMGCNKAGFSKGKQRYKCKSCGKIFSLGDRRVKYSIEQKMEAIKLYTEGVGLRTIERISYIGSEGLSKMLKQHFGQYRDPRACKRYRNTGSGRTICLL